MGWMGVNYVWTGWLRALKHGWTGGFKGQNPVRIGTDLRNSVVDSGNFGLFLGVV